MELCEYEKQDPDRTRIPPPLGILNQEGRRATLPISLKEANFVESYAPAIFAVLLLQVLFLLILFLLV